MRAGSHHTEKTKKLMSASHAGGCVSEVSRKKLSNSLKGRKLSNLHCQHMSDVRKGKPLSEKCLQNSIAIRKGIPRTAEDRKKISDGGKGKHGHLVGRVFSETHKKKISDSRWGENNPMFGKHHSRETRIKMSVARSGDKCHLWKGGISFEPYCPKFTKEFKERVRAFFGYQCQLPGCNHVWQPGEKKLSVHHVNYRKDSCCSDVVIPLFIPVCSGSCHAVTNNHREYWEKYFTDLINEKFGGKCYLPKVDSGVI